MDTQPLVSVIIPTYNRLEALGELLESLSRQTYPHLQIIIVNDAGESVERVTALYPELDTLVLTMESNGKHVAARNLGLTAVRGEYILLCDDDDLLLPAHVERMVRELQDSDLVYSDVEIFDYTVVEGTRRPTGRFIFAYEHDLEAMRKFSTFVASGCLYRRELHERLGPFDTEVYHYWDWDFFLRASESFRVKRVPVASALYAFASAGGNLSGPADSMRPYLDKLSAKHGLGELPTANFFLLLEEPDVKSRKAVTEVSWDGEPFVSRLTGFGGSGSREEGENG
ncbi:Glycosyl transferase family 2 [Paenibacillus sp. UNCCL117]|uniref:glycosyltransferase family 2 protein n=1 Tax=unclassified Paenibacillus TaxID=185978 RepID=UPI0008866E1A|nr:MULTISPECIES: glycosyltransferase [unclassified Paenibacillus]SDD78215.1 Glycosyl transferase family 2 [Paenibacillus sp. cl123]SFW52921.1 Glycosyl transferase family 2 [Paenibacillus sp. UNCCL117]